MENTILPQKKVRINALNKKDLEHMQKRENAAITVCAGLLGDCYIMAEVIDWMLIPSGADILAELKSQKWFKQDIKYHINKAVDALRQNLINTKQNAITKVDFMQDMADNTYNALKLDLFKLKNGIMISLNSNIESPGIIADFYIIDMLFQWIVAKYDIVMEHMQKDVYPTPTDLKFYDSWFYHIKNEGAAKHWATALDLFDTKYLKKYGFVKDNSLITLGFTAINNRMNDSNLKDRLREETSKWTEEGLGNEKFCEAYDLLMPNN